MKWPDYYCAERTLDVKHISGRVARVWCDPKVWKTGDEMRRLAERVHNDLHDRRSSTLEDTLAVLANIPGVNAVQVTDQDYGSGSPGRLGVMAYLVPFDRGA